jgi:ribosomal protein S7
MKKLIYINLDIFNGLYSLYVKTLLGKFIKKGKKFKALKLYKHLKEIIKLNTKKRKEVSFIFLLSMLNSMPKVSFKEIRLGSQKKDLPMPINEKKQVLVCVETLLKICKNKKKLELEKLADCIISSYKNKGIVIRNKNLKYKKAIINKMLLSIIMPRKQKNKREKKINVSEKINYKIFKNKTTL